jgi:hypothetical protein
MRDREAVHGRRRCRPSRVEAAGRRRVESSVLRGGRPAEGSVTRAVSPPLGMERVTCLALRRETRLRAWPEEEQPPESRGCKPRQEGQTPRRARGESSAPRDDTCTAVVVEHSRGGALTRFEPHRQGSRVRPDNDGPQPLARPTLHRRGVQRLPRRPLQRSILRQRPPPAGIAPPAQSARAGSRSVDSAFYFTETRGSRRSLGPSRAASLLRWR